MGKFSISKNVSNKIPLVIKVPKLCSHSRCANGGIYRKNNLYLCKFHYEKKKCIKRCNLINSKSDEELEKCLNNLISEIHFNEIFQINKTNSLDKNNILIFKLIKHFVYKRCTDNCDLCKNQKKLKSRLISLIKKPKIRELHYNLKKLSLDNK